VCRLCDLVLEEVTDDGITPPPAAAAAVAYLLSKEEDVVLATVSWQSGDITSNDEDGQSRERSMFLYGHGQRRSMVQCNGQWSCIGSHYLQLRTIRKNNWYQYLHTHISMILFYGNFTDRMLSRQSPLILRTLTGIYVHLRIGIYVIIPFWKILYIFVFSDLSMYVSRGVRT